MERIVIRHLSGSKTNQVEEFPLAHFRELSIGRDPSATLKYDPDRDDLVGRQHARITQDAADPTAFSITDLNSRNGTFLNKQRVVGTVRVHPGDLIQLGAGGPEFQFDVEPRPAGVARPTRVGGEAATLTGGAPPTRTGGAVPVPVPTAAGATASTRVGKATVERMISQQKSESRKWIAVVAVLLLLAIVAVAAGFGVKYVYDARKHAQEEKERQAEMEKLGTGLTKVTERTSTMTPGEIAAAATPATVFIQFSWELIHVKSGKPLFFQFVRNAYQDPQGRVVPIVQDGRQFVMAWKYVQTPQGGKAEPWLTTESGLTVPVGFAGASGSGFCVSNEGFIITNRHVAANWKAMYQSWLFDPNAQRFFFPAVLMQDDLRSPYVNQAGQPILIGPQVWVPADTQQFGPSTLGNPMVEGRNEVLNVTFPKNENRIPATLERVSDRHDVAMIKINVPSGVSKVELNDNYDTIKLGDAVTVLGYPAGSVQRYVVVGSQTGQGQSVSEQVGIIPDPTLSTGNIGKIVRGEEPVPGKDPLTGKDTVISSLGDVYQLTVNSTGGGNSGGPVFDDHGRVIAIYTYGVGSDFQASAAVPIRFAKELMSVK